MDRKYSDLANTFLDTLFAEMSSKNIELKVKEIDHLCFRTSSQEDYENICLKFESFGTCLIESMVGGRMISTYKLKTPFRYKDFLIPLVEIPAPKQGGSHQLGFEHIECVVDESFDELMKKYAHLKLETKALCKKLNPELEIVLNSGSIKFHHQSLERVIEIEKMPQK